MTVHLKRVRQGFIVTGIFLLHQSCAMFLLILSLMNGSLKDTISPSKVLPNSNGFSIIIVSFFVIIECKDSNNLLSKKNLSKNFITN